MRHRAIFPVAIILTLIPTLVWIHYNPCVDCGLRWDVFIPQWIVIAGIIIIQQIYHRRSWDMCGNCGHHRYMHDKEQMTKEKFGILNPVICDNFDHAYEETETNYDHKYLEK